MKVLISLTVTLTFYVSLCQSSAIPMWEYLSREEKMSMLFNVYAKQVQSYCDTKDGEQLRNCKDNMMMYGVVKLHEMNEASLDKMDPYQRGADNILWDSMMNGDDDQHSTAAMFETTKDERQEYLQNEQFHQQSQFHKEEEVHDGRPSMMSFSEDADEDEMVNYLHHDGAASHNNFAYVNKPDDLDQHEHLEQNSNYLTGPMVTYMMPDGTPVKNMIQQMPIDEDREDMEMTKTRMPTMEDIYKRVETMDEKPKIIIASPPSVDETTEAVPLPPPEQQHRQSRIVKTISGAYRVMH